MANRITDPKLKDGYNSSGSSELHDYSEAESEDETEEEEPEEFGIAMNMPKRVTKANRYSKVMRESDDEFWKHETWDEENNDEEYVCSEGEEQYKDIIDSDFDDNEDDTTSDEETVEVESKPKKKTSIYQDPSQIKHKVKRKAMHYTNKIKAKRLTDSKMSQSENLCETQNEAHDGIKQQMKTRRTTREQSEQIEIIRQEREVEKKLKASKRSRLKTIPEYIYREPTQEEHLKEAQRTEEENKQSLITLQEWEEERKRSIEHKKQKYQGHYTVWISWASDRLIMSEETVKQSELDQHFNVYDPKDNPPAKYFKIDSSKDAPELLIFTDGCLPEDYSRTEMKTSHPRCLVTGNKAKYLDPLTKCFYDSSASFKTLRQWYYDAQDVKILSELKEIDAQIKLKLQEYNDFVSQVTPTDQNV